VIRTPDQRVRVFVSSTLGELAPERRAVTSAITQMRLTPVLFELGARPYAPRDLYRAYLKQSDVFVGVYAESYGWIAPGMEVSGLEDEYRLAADMPRLIYMKETARRDSRPVTSRWPVARRGPGPAPGDQQSLLRVTVPYDVPDRLAAARTRGDPAAFDRGLAEGQGWTIDRAVDAGLATAPRPPKTPAGSSETVD
jgi:hypothetical protein